MDAPTLGPRDWLSFAGQSVIVTGAATGIGEAAARAFAALHAEVTLVDIGPDLQRVAAAITSQNGRPRISTSNPTEMSSSSARRCSRR